MFRPLPQIGFTTLQIYTILKLRWSPLTTNLVLLPYRFTLFSNLKQAQFALMKSFTTLLLYNILTPSQLAFHKLTKFYYLFHLHFSHTRTLCLVNSFLFYYLIDLHYSQTQIALNIGVGRFYYLIDLHYSQTNKHPFRGTSAVLLPYRFTLF